MSIKSSFRMSVDRPTDTHRGRREMARRWPRPQTTGAWGTLCLVVVMLGLAFPTAVGAQGKKQDDEPTYEDIVLRTKDGVSLTCSYFFPQGDVEGKKVVPIILLHGWDESRRRMVGLARYLQKLGHAVIVPDLRGHGGSTTVATATGDKEIDRSRMSARDVQGMVRDVETVKRYLLQKNNQGEVNIELLCVVGSELGAIVGLNWSAVDWSVPNLGTYKQGQDVKAIIMLSPLQSFKGLNTREGLKQPAVRSSLVSTMILVGTEARHYSDAKKIYNSLERFHKNSEEESLALVDLDTSLEGSEILPSELGQSVADSIAKFIKSRLVDRSNQLPWQDRTNPFK